MPWDKTQHGSQYSAFGVNSVAVACCQAVLVPLDTARSNKKAIPKLLHNHGRIGEKICHLVNVAGEDRQGLMQLVLETTKGGERHGVRGGEAWVLGGSVCCCCSGRTRGSVDGQAEGEMVDEGLVSVIKHKDPPRSLCISFIVVVREWDLAPVSQLVWSSPR